MTKQCRIAEVFRELGNTKIGYRFKCGLDYEIARGYDEEMELEIVECLMQGDGCCIHRYSKVAEE